MSHILADVTLVILCCFASIYVWEFLTLLVGAIARWVKR